MTLTAPQLLAAWAVINTAATDKPALRPLADAVLNEWHALPPAGEEGSIHV